MTLQGGISTGQTTADFCDVRNNLPELNLAVGAGLQTSNINTGQPVLRRVERLPHAVPRPGLLRHPEDRRAGERDLPEQARAGDRRQLGGSGARSSHSRLGRPLAGGAPNVTVNLIEPGTVSGNRINQLDLRPGEERAGLAASATMLSMDLYNALNTGAILTYNATYAPPDGNGAERLPAATDRGHATDGPLHRGVQFQSVPGSARHTAEPGVSLPSSVFRLPSSVFRLRSPGFGLQASDPGSGSGSRIRIPDPDPGSRGPIIGNGAQVDIADCVDRVRVGRGLSCR